MDFNGAQLRLARIFNGMTLEDVARRVDCTRQYIHKLEVNQNAPTETLRAQLAEILRVKPGFFCLPRVEVSEEQFHFRKLFSTRTVLKQAAIARAELFGRLVNYLDDLLSLPKINIPTLEVTGVEDIERAAEFCRREWELGFGPIGHMTRLAENIGALVTSFPGVSTEIDALSVALRRPIIVRNDAKPGACRQRFDIGHEIGHFVLHEGKITGDRISESEANRFASAFLVPRTMMGKLFPRPRGTRLDWKGLTEFKMTWKVSKAALLYRARQLGLITDAQYRTGIIHLRCDGEANGEREDKLIPQEQPELLKRALELLAQRKGIYAGEIADALELREDSLADLVRFDPPRAPKKPVLKLVS